MAIVPTRRRGGYTQTALNTVAAMAGSAVNKALNKQVNKMADKVMSRAKQSRSAPPPSSKRNNPQRSQISSISGPTSFGSASTNSLARSQVISSTANSSIVRGSTVLGPVLLPAGFIVGKPTAAFYASSNPLTFSDRMQTLASTYDKYVYHRATLRYIPNVGSSTAGQIAITIDRDYLDPPQTAGYAQTLSYEAQAFGSVWVSHSCTITRDTHEKRAYFTNFTADPALRESEQFKFYAYTLGAIASNAPLGYLVLDYEIELISPVFAPVEVSSNTGNLVMVPTITTMTFNLPGSDVCAISALPSALANPGSVYEIIVQGQPDVTDIVYGSAAGAPYTPAAQGSYIFYCRGTIVGSFHVYTDYNSCVSNSAQARLFNNAAALNVFLNSCGCTYRLLAISQ